jgi:hypothetical protein
MKRPLRHLVSSLLICCGFRWAHSMPSVLPSSLRSRLIQCLSLPFSHLPELRRWRFPFSLVKIDPFVPVEARRVDSLALEESSWCRGSMCGRRVHSGNHRKRKVRRCQKVLLAFSSAAGTDCLWPAPQPPLASTASLPQ